ncbi:thioredoxin domain-containing protein [Polyangium mundeleinium]|uniref:Thioredoxin domain-containing protein n=1 Tax=Polyangium mundeleinium TaxID=2995306 RepID=A0ABT5EPQ4_9BACT|nr:thioredoxin domain-containing protein [Polyangium mundeleinium]MDC0743822.1 thioredoxin domain-containing protein [Polyangium mundeleinium]
MNHARGRRRAAFVSTALILLAACAPPPPVQPAVAVSQDEPGRRPLAVPEAANEGEGAAALPDPGTAIPVGPDAPAWGNPLAPVTMVIWGDFECPFTSRLMATLALLQQQYGPDKLRVVWKHNPLPFHRNARPAHLAAETVLRLGGASAFWKFHALAFRNQRSLDVPSFNDWAAQSGIDPWAFQAAFDQQRFAANVDADLAFAKQVGVRGTPASFINGIFLAGAQPLTKFQEAIDAELEEAAALRRKGVPPERVYAELSEQNYKNAPPPVPPPPPPSDSDTAWKIPLDGSPARGKSTALVTMVMFGDFQCPFCKRSIATLTELEAKYGDKLRLVFKHNPLPMHSRAEAAAELAIEAGVQKGEAAFWKAFQALFDTQDRLADPELENLAIALGLDVKRVKKAIASHTHAARIERDLDLADDFKVMGTPHFFVNGRRLIGAQPREAFEALIDEEIKKAEKLIAAGTPAANIYDALQKDAKGPEPVERILAPAPTKDHPAKGAPAGAAVTIQMFADFQCPFSKRAQPVIDELIAAFPGKVRVVWRHFPLSFHKHAQLAAEASVEAFRQKGEAGFWAFSARLWEDQTEQGLSRPAIERKAAEAGLDVAKLSAALDARTHWKVVQADLELAERLKITGTPAFVINDYFVGNAQPLRNFKRIVTRALKPNEPIASGTLKADARQPVPLVATSPPPLSPPPSPSPAPPAPAASAVTPAGHLGAKHLIVMYAGSKRAPATITRSRSEALALAQDAHKRLQAGARFDDIVAQYSDEPGAAQRGGDLGTFPKGAMVREFEDAVLNLGVGETSGIVESPFGFHIIVRTQ